LRIAKYPQDGKGQGGKDPREGAKRKGAQKSAGRWKGHNFLGGKLQQVRGKGIVCGGKRSERPTESEIGLLDEGGRPKLVIRHSGCRMKFSRR